MYNDGRMCFIFLGASLSYISQISERLRVLLLFYCSRIVINKTYDGQSLSNLQICSDWMDTERQNRDALRSTTSQ